MKVDRVTVSYYDGGKEFLQSVYRFTATVMFKNRKLRSANRHVVGYLSIGEAVEPLPTLGKKQGKLSREPSKYTTTKKSSSRNDPTVGRYVVRNDTSEWVDSANEFMDGIRGAGFFGSSIPFIDSQYFWAEPYEFTSNKDSFINSVNIQYMPILFRIISSTRNHSCCEIVDYLWLTYLSIHFINSNKWYSSQCSKYYRTGNKRNRRRVIWR